MSSTIKSQKTGLWNKLRYFLGSEAAASRRKRLARDISKNPLADIKSIIKTERGKFFQTPITTSSIKNSIKVPNFTAETVSDSVLDLTLACKEKVTLLAFGFSSYSESQLESFRRPFINDIMSKEEDCQIIDFRPLMTRFKWFVFSRLMKSSAISAIPEALQKSFIVAYRPFDLVDALEIPNYLGSFVYLIDRKGLIRWKACGEASPEELEIMKKITIQLLKERE